MKIALTIDLGGYFFSIDEDAYEELKSYLNNLEHWFSGEESSSEIINDIEVRMAELLRARLSDSRDVITIKDVREVIEVLGVPEDIAGNGGKESKGKSGSSGSHRMYRDPDKRILGGVCAGMGAYWRIDPLIIRVIFLALIFAGGIGIIIYLILWIVLPEAKTTAQKIEMRGETVDINTIKEAVKSEFEKVRKKMNM
ncbi:MAG: PspC domain-containing protein [Bacteroidales bacterium]|nr:PspC domain-containing protein [Bacteroidales bacterium]